jgi:hypothetical protein
VSFYKHSLSGREEWRALRRFDPAGRQPAALGEGP